MTTALILAGLFFLAMLGWSICIAGKRRGE